MGSSGSYISNFSEFLIHKIENFPLYNSQTLVLENGLKIIFNKDELAYFRLPFNEDRNRHDILKSVTYEEVTVVAEKYLDPSEFYYVIIGDKFKLLEPLKALNMGEVVEVFL